MNFNALTYINDCRNQNALSSPKDWFEEFLINLDQIFFQLKN
jgi:hypothetical protein